MTSGPRSGSRARRFCMLFIARPAFRSGRFLVRSTGASRCTRPPASWAIDDRRRGAEAPRPISPLGAGLPPRSWLVDVDVSLVEAPQLLLGPLTSISVPLSDGPGELVEASIRLGQVVVGELAPLLLHLAAELLPLAGHNVAIHSRLSFLLDDPMREALGLAGRSWCKSYAASRTLISQSIALNSSRLNFPTEKQFRSIPMAGTVGALRTRQRRMPWTFQALRDPQAAPRGTWHRRCLSLEQANSLKRQASRRRKEGRTHGHHRDRLAGASPGRRAADLAL